MYFDVTGIISTRYRNTRMFADAQVVRCNEKKCKRCICPDTLLWQQSHSVGGGSMKLGV
jgi:hypothetical protein